MIDKEYLRTHAEHRKELQDELQRYELDHGHSYYGKSPSNIDGMPHAVGGFLNGTYDQVNRTIDTETYIDKLETLVNEEQREIEKVLKLLNKADQKSVIRYKYYNCLEWEDVAFYLYCNNRNYCENTDYYKNKAQKIHGAALANMIKAQK